MATLMSVHTSHGEGGRCDSRCYDAITPVSDCDCICGGANHGVGLRQATENTEEVAKLVMAALPAGKTLTVEAAQQQFDL